MKAVFWAAWSLSPEKTVRRAPQSMSIQFQISLDSMMQKTLIKFTCFTTQPFLLVDDQCSLILCLDPLQLIQNFLTFFLFKLTFIQEGVFNVREKHNHVGHHIFHCWGCIAIVDQVCWPTMEKGKQLQATLISNSTTTFDIPYSKFPSISQHQRLQFGIHT